MFDIVYEDPETKEKKHVVQNSWGITTRTIGVMIMVHADDKGLVLPPNIAKHQVVIVPCGISSSLAADEREKLYNFCKKLENDLAKDNIKVIGDYRENYSPGWKFNHWELKGVPIRIEVGPRDMKNQQVVTVRRDTGTKECIQVASDVGKSLGELLKSMQKEMFQRAKDSLDNNVVRVEGWQDFARNLEDKKLLLAPFCGQIKCEDGIKALSKKDESSGGATTAADQGPSMGAKSLCIPFEQPAEDPGKVCVNPGCANEPRFFTLFGRSY
eukprot:07509.XXX_108739_110346_1 [CDS] Oithona nana genome sequencing.